MQELLSKKGLHPETQQENEQIQNPLSLWQASTFVKCILGTTSKLTNLGKVWFIFTILSDVSIFSFKFTSFICDFFSVIQTDLQVVHFFLGVYQQIIHETVGLCEV